MNFSNRAHCLNWTSELSSGLDGAASSPTISSADDSSPATIISVFRSSAQRVDGDSRTRFEIVDPPGRRQRGQEMTRS
jgi:hypothetical protein